MKYIFITKEGDPLPIADRLADEGAEVIVGLIDKDGCNDIAPSVDAKRRENYEGITTTNDAETVMRGMKDLSDKDDYFVMFDYGDLWPWSERALDMGFTNGIFPTEEGYKLEDDRSAGKAFAEQHYPNVKVAQFSEFKKVDEAVEFLAENPDKIYVLKSEGSNAETVVPSTSDPELARRQIVGALRTEAQEYEKGGFTLEEKIKHPLEFSPVMLFWQGEPLFSLVELENKHMGAGNIGRLSGGCQNLTIRTPLDCKLNQLAFPPVIYEMARKQPGVGIYDAGLLYDGEHFYFTEFCSQRWGWDGIFSEIAMSGTASRHFQAIGQGKNPILQQYGAAVRLFQTQPSSTDAEVYEDGYRMDWLDEVSDRLWFYCIKADSESENGKPTFVSCGYRKDLGVATGASDYLESAVESAYEAARGFAMTGVYYRPKFDFMSREYPTSIMRRWSFLANSGLIG